MNSDIQPQTKPAFIEMENIWKSFPGVKANKGVHLDLRAGEVHALLGENGAGKTTLMNILSGLYKADQGEIRINGQPVVIQSPHQAIQYGIGMVHQHFRLVDNMTVAENIHLGWQQTPWHVSHASLAERTHQIAAQMGFTLDTKSKVWQLSVGEQQRVEIVRTLARGARLLILDEPTAVLTPGEAVELFNAIRSLTAQGRTVVFISHKLDEVLEISDRVTVLRDGCNVETRPISECNHRLLAQWMVGQNLIFQSLKKTGEPGPVILEAKDIRAVNDRGLPALVDISFDVKAGEILGIAGVSGNGQGELAEVLTGLRPVKSGKFLIDGKEMTGKSPRELGKAGVGHIPEDRLDTGLVGSLSITHNAILRRYREAPIQQGARMVANAARQFTDQIIQQADVRCPNPEVKAQTLSGGNQQKLVAGREMDIASHLLVAVHPTRGLDVAATEELHRSLVDYRNQGNAILLISADLDEILLLSDRIGVMYEGKLVGIVNAADADREKIGLMMGGGENERKRT